MANAIVTGGSRGLGLDIVRALASDNRKVIAISRSTSPELDNLIKQFPRSVRFEPFDFAAPSGLEPFVKSLRKKHGAVSALVNNAATGIDGVLTTLPEVDIEAALRVNLLAPILFTRAVVKTMLVDGGGRIVNITSVNAFTGYNGLSVYAATKAGLIGFTKSLAREVGRANILVNAVAPGLIETAMTTGITDERRDKIKRRSPLQRFAGVDEVTNAVMFLLSEQSSGMTGSVITVDAGNSA